VARDQTRFHDFIGGKTLNDQRNMFIAILLSALVLIGGMFISERFFPQPKPAVTAPSIAAANGTANGTAAALPPGAAAPAKPPAMVDAKIALAGSPRIAIETPKLRGSIALKGARFDDLLLLTHKTTTKADATPVRLLSPAGTEHGYFAGFGWTGDGLVAPGADTLWTASAGKLTPETPVTLSWANGQGQNFEIKLAVDKDFMFTVEQSMANAGAAPISVRSNAFISRSFGLLQKGSPLAGPSHDVDSWTMHVGPIGTFNAKTDYSVKYTGLDEAGAAGQRFTTKGGWLGFGDTYWLTALAPAQDASVDAGFQKGGTTYQADFANTATIVAPTKAIKTTTHLFAGAKEVISLDGYEKSLGIANFGKAIDWGWFEIVAKPMFYLLHFLFNLVGNFGVAIALLTLTVKSVMFPIAQKQFAGMAKMRVVQPKMKALQERYKDDKPKLQQETMALYQKEKINPASGCLPIFIQIPIFYALYKVLLLSIEMRHQHFLWIKDLSGPDPMFFGLTPGLQASIPAMIALGVLPVLLGITMWLQFKLNPAPVDPVQQQVFSIMPWVLMFIMAPFAAGLQLYWVCNNTLTILQQKFLYRKYPMPPAEPAKK
jgi:YidC/Oxa1 family membrane protein insertase